MNLNKAFIAGNLTADPEKKVTEKGTTIVNFSIASNRYYTTSDGEKKQDTEFHDVVFFGKTAENIAKYLSKGSSALVEGRIQTRSWEDDNGNKRYSTEIIGQNIQFGSSPDKKEDIDESEYIGGETKKEDIPVVEEDEDIDVEDIPF